MAKRYKHVSEVLAAALEKFGPNGERWIQYREHSTKTGEDSYCLIGAIKATTRGRLQQEAEEKVYEACRHKEPGTYGIPMFNDRGGRNFSEIKDVMCRAITKAVAEEEDTNP